METQTAHPEFFNQRLNYTLANEDTRFELEVLEEGLNKIVTVCGSGSRAIPILSKSPKELVIVDVSPAQLALAELRLETVRQLSYEEFLCFWGYPQQSLPHKLQLRKVLFEKLELTPAVRQTLQPIFQANHYETLLYSGSWEQSFAKLAKITTKILGPTAIEDFFERGICLPQVKWAIVLALIGNSKVFNSLMYQGDFPKKNISESFFRFYWNAFQRLFAQGNPKQNYFLQLCFFGKLKYPEGLPTEADRDVFEKAKAALSHTRVTFRSGSIISVLENETEVSAVSLSDVPSYFKGPLEQNFMQMIWPALSANAKVINRYYLHVPKPLNTTGYQDISSEYQNEIQHERMQMYQIQVFEKIEATTSTQGTA